MSGNPVNQETTMLEPLLCAGVLQCTLHGKSLNGPGDNTFWGNRNQQKYLRRKVI